ncbi:hypothetical protein [Natrinema hispanicum]|nr:hypothetical protein [Natrinema hispanicum]
MLETVETLTVFVFLTAVAVSAARDRLSSDADPVAEVKRLYVEARLTNRNLNS